MKMMRMMKKPKMLNMMISYEHDVHKDKYDK